MDYIAENNLAFAADALGFPSIMGCQAICYQTSRGLYGFHDYKSGTQGRKDQLTPLEVSNKKLGIFAKWVTDQIQTAENPVALYGVINRNEQYASTTSGNADWKNVLLGLAGKLSFTGDVYGARINSHLGNGESAYVQFNLAGTNLTVGFKRWSKMELDFNNKIAPDVIQERVVSRLGTFGAESLFGKGEIAPVVRKDTTKGFNLNRIAQAKFFKFQ